MSQATWQRTLTSTAAELREQAALEEEEATDDERATTLRRAARAFREAARLLDDAEAMIAGALAAAAEGRKAAWVEPWVMADLRARRRAGAMDEELLALLREPARGGLTEPQARSVVVGLSARSGSR